MINKLIPWHKKLRQLLLILASVVILSIIVCQVFSSLESKKTWAERNKRSDYYKAVIEGLEFSGLDEQTMAAIQEYRAILGSNSNLIVTDDNGVIIYHANNGFIPDEGHFIVLINPENKYTNKAYIIDGDNNVRYRIQFEQVYNGMRLAKYSNNFAEDTNVFANMEYFESAIVNYSNLGSLEKTMHYAYIGSKGWNVYSIQDILRSAYPGFDRIQYWFSTIGLAVLVFFWLILPIWTFIDAKKRNYKPALWGILTLLSNIIGLIIYILTRPEIFVCQGCGELLNDKHIFCPYCGTANRDICTSCKKIIEKSWIACPYCGQKAKNSRPDQVSLPEEA